MNETDDKVKKLEDWFCELIEIFRTEYDKLTPDEKRNILNDNDYSSPCQIEVFWISEPFDFQMMVKTHDQRRKDKEIIINGPFKKSDFRFKLIEIMGEKRWNNNVPYKQEETLFLDEINIGFEGVKYSDYLVNKINLLYWYLENPHVSSFDNLICSGEMIKEKDYVRFIKGNIADFKKTSTFVEEIIKAANYCVSSSSTLNPIIDQTSRDNATEVHYMGAYYYPLLRIGDNVELSFSQKLSVLLEEAIFEPTKEFEFTFCGKKVFYDSFGFLAIQIENKEGGKEGNKENKELERQNKATKMLNTIFGTRLLCGYNCLSIKASELVHIKEIPENSRVFVSSWQHTDTKRPLSNTRYGHRKYQIEIASMVQIIKSAEIIYNDENLDELLLLLLESFAHYYDSEYSQSFIYSWFIIEKHIAQLFDKMIVENNITGERKKKFRKHDKWSSDSRIEVLNITGILPIE
ncbi:hypothetical protein HNV12_11685 [Methanococcoides sp. SA1]|nr:hypothetical protein [Methanococcoides sp. SA1]